MGKPISKNSQPIKNIYLKNLEDFLSRGEFKKQQDQDLYNAVVAFMAYLSDNNRSISDNEKNTHLRETLDMLQTLYDPNGDENKKLARVDTFYRNTCTQAYCESRIRSEEADTIARLLIGIAITAFCVAVTAVMCAFGTGAVSFGVGAPVGFLLGAAFGLGIAASIKEKIFGGHFFANAKDTLFCCAKKVADPNYEFSEKKDFVVPFGSRTY